jgi:hypothetical protein
MFFKKDLNFVLQKLQEPSRNMYLPQSLLHQSTLGRRHHRFPWVPAIYLKRRMYTAQIIAEDQTNAVYDLQIFMNTSNRGNKIVDYTCNINLGATY